MRVLLTFIAFVLLGGCNPYKDYLENDNVCDFDNPIYTLKKEDREFDMDKYSDSFNEGILIVHDNTYEKNIFYRINNFNTIVNKQTNKQIFKDRLNMIL